MTEHSDEQPTLAENRFVTLVVRHRLGALIMMTIVIAVVCSTIGISLYYSSGTAQLDLTRPDYEGVSDTLAQSGEASLFVDYPGYGTIDEAALKEFDALYKRQLENIHSVDAFGGDPMSLESLHIENRAL